MFDPIAFIDAHLAIIPPLARIALWGLASALFSMGVYGLVSPQQKIKASKSAQKEARHALKGHDGDLRELWQLTRRDMRCSLQSMRLMLPALALSFLPIVALVYRLSQFYTQPSYLSLPLPLWMRGFDFCYFAVFFIVSFIIKLAFRLV